MDHINFQKFQVNEELREITFSCASETPVERWDQHNEICYNEVLVITEESVDLTRLNNGAPVLFNHDSDKLLGMVEQAFIQDGKIYVRVRFSPNDEFANRIYLDIIQGIIKNVSIGYEIIQYEDKFQNGTNIRYVTKFMIYETSIVSIPADNEVGFRSHTNKELVMEEEKLENQEEVKEEAQETTPELETVLQENEELKKELEALKANLSEQEETKLEEEIQEEEVSDAEEIEKIAEDFEIDDETVRKALDSKLTVREFKKQIFNTNKKEKTMNTKNEFREYLNARDFSKPFSIRDFSGFAPSGLVGTETLPLIQALDKRLGVKGYRTMTGLTSNISIPVQATRPTVYTPGINEASTDSNPTFEQVTLSPVKFTASTVIGKEVLYNSNSDVESFIVDAILKELSYAIEKHMLDKVVDAANTEITYTALSAITWADILAMEAAVDGYLVDNMNFVMSPAARAALKGTPKATDTVAGFICQGNEINGYACNVSGVVGNDNIYFGDWSELVLGTWSGMDIMIDPYTESRSGNLVVVGSILADAAVVQKDAFCIGKVQDSSSSSESSSSESSSSGKA